MPKFAPATLLASIIAATAIAASVPQSAHANQYCQCVGYVKQVFGITRPMGNAKDMIYSLPNHGFSSVSEPQKGDVVVMSDTFPGSDRTYGHVGLVEDIVNGKVVVRGANQGRGQFSEAGCRNVSIIRFRTPFAGRSDISFWRR